MKRKRVGLWPATLCHSRQWLWRALEELFPLSFVEFESDAASRLDAVIAAAAEQGPACLAMVPKIPCLVSVGLFDQGEGAVKGEAVVFEEHMAVPAVFRGRTLADDRLTTLPSLRVAAGDQVVASQLRRPVWIHRPAVNGTAGRDMVALPLPVLSQGACLRECCHGGNFLETLPLLGFLQRLTAREGWRPALQRACFVFDDPSLRWPSYGFVNYQQLARHAQNWNYHAAIGFIPLDAAWVNRSVAAIFRANATHLSLVIHGCDHLHMEMARTYSPTQRMALCAQALRRVERVERQHSLSVCRVMEPPFGVIDQAMFAALVALGYEAALITTSQFLDHHPGVQFATGFGRQAARPLAGGLGMIPRITMKPHWQTEAMLAASLGQPIVIAGHHWDAANGLATLEGIAETVNGFGDVRWCSIAEIARANYMTRLVDATLSVSLGARRIRLPVPEGVGEVIIHRPWMADNVLEPLIVRYPDQTVQVIQAATAESAPIVVKLPGTIEICSPVANPVKAEEVLAPPVRLWPYVRRALTEVRDQASPLLRRQFNSRRAGGSRRRLITPK